MTERLIPAESFTSYSLIDAPFEEAPRYLMDPIAFIYSCPLEVQAILGLLTGACQGKLVLPNGIQIPPLWW